MSNEEFEMPILWNIHERRWRDGFPDKVLMPMECQEQAKQNHQQTLERLKERGGLDLTEIVAVMESRPWRQMTVVELVDAFRKYHWI